MKPAKILENRRLADGIFPFCFVVSAMFNMAIFYVGLAFQENPYRVYVYGICDVVFVLLCAAMLLWTLRVNRPQKKGWILLTAVVLFYGAVYVSGFVRFGFDGTLLHYASRFAALSVPSFLAGVYAALNRTEGRFFDKMESLSFFILPAGLAYFNGIVFNCSPYDNGRNLGVYNYMAMAYYFLPFMTVHMIQLADGKPFVLPGGSKPMRYPQLLRAALIVVYWYDIIGSGTRGAFVCVGVFCVLLVLFQLFYRQPVGRALLAVALIVLVVLIVIFPFSRPATEQSIQRWDVVIEGAQSGQIVTSNEVSTSRGTLYKYAIQEFLDSPITGMGPFNYSLKYGQYPHNGLLELLCELGLAGFLPLAALGIYMLVRMLQIGRTNQDVRNLVLFLSAFAVRANVSDTIWDCPPLLAALGFVLAWRTGEKRLPEEQPK